MWHGDSGAVAEIVANLLENAFRYSPPGSAVGLHCREGADRLLITVWDGGAAIASDEQDIIFERGRRGSAGSALPGTGLGLALARDLAQRLGGDLSLLIPPCRVDSALPANGNAFCLSLPPASSKAQP